MMEPIAGAPAGVIAYRAVGTVSAEDYTGVLQPAIAAAAAGSSGVRIVIELGDAYDGYSAGAAWEDLSLGSKHLSEWHRCAVVTDHRALGDAIRVVGALMPGDVRVFPVAERQAALREEARRVRAGSATPEPSTRLNPTTEDARP